MDPQAEIEELKTQTQILMSQAVSDFERRVRNVASLVMGRLVRSASVSTPAKSALSTYFSQSQKQRHLQQPLTKNRLQSTPQNFARQFDSLYSARCGVLRAAILDSQRQSCTVLIRQQFAAGREHPTDSALTQMVVDIKSEALYPIVQSRGNCDCEFVVLNNFATVRSMFL
ncbi:TPA: hypothetical protein ACH3X1_004407 [Trebouxia sp. C0004]